MAEGDRESAGERKREREGESGRERAEEVESVRGR